MNNSKLETVTVLYDETCRQITANSENWQDFLKSTCHNYKLRFDEKILVYAQKPDARAVLELASWSKYFGRYVARGSKGIAVFDNLQRNHSLKHYFDITDTIPTEHSRNVPIWEIDNDNINTVIEYFNSNYSHNDDLGVMIQDAVKEEVTEFINNNFDSNIEDSVIELSVNSSALVIMERLGINSTQHFYDMDFDGVTELNTSQVINNVGSIVNVTSTKILSDIAMHLTLEQRRKNYETDIQTGRGLSNSEFISTESGSNRQVRKPTSGLSPKSQDTTLHQSSDISNTERPLTDNSEGSREQNGLSDRGNEENSGSYGTAEEREYDGVGSNDEPDNFISRGNSVEGTDLHLTEELEDTKTIVKPLITIEEQKEIIETEVENTSVFYISDDVINKCLQSGSGFVDGKFRIYKHFQNSLSDKDNADFLKNEYGIGGHYPAHSEAEIRYGFDYDSKGVKIQSSDNHIEDVHLSWTTVAKKIKYLISCDKYLNPEEATRYPEWLISSEIKTATVVDSTISKKEEYQFNVGDTVYLDANEYEILSINEDFVVLFDVNYPLINTEMERAVFNQKVASTSSNDHLKVEVDNLSTYDNEVVTVLDKEEQIQTDIDINTFQIYQLDESNSNTFGLSFLPYAQIGGEVNPTNYIQIYSAPLEENTSLEDIFRIFNSDYERPKNFYGHSLSVSDIVVINKDGNTTAHYVDRIGFKQVKEFEKALENGVNIPKLQTNDVFGEYMDIYFHNPDSIVAVQVGEFYEFWDKSAEYISESMSLKLTKRKVNGIDIEMCGVPAKDINLYVNSINKDNKIAVICSVDKNENITIEHKVPETLQKDNIRKALNLKLDIKLVDPVYEETYVNNGRATMVSNLHIVYEDGFYCLRGDSKKSGTTTENVILSRFFNVDEVIRYLHKEKIEAEDYTVNAPIPVSKKDQYRYIDINDAISMFEHNFSVYRTDDTQIIFDDELWDKPANEYQCKISDYQQEKMIDEIASYFDKMNERFSLITSELGQPYFLNLYEYADNYEWDFDDGKTVYQNTALLLTSNEFSPLINYLNTAIEELKSDSEYEGQYNLAVNTNNELEKYIDTYFNKTSETVVESTDTTTDTVLEQLTEKKIVAKPQKKIDFVINDTIYPTGKKEKFKNNIEAIKTLKNIQSENRLATADEQVTLSKYVGWGGIPEAFDKNNTSWSNEYLQLSSLLSDTEYSEARASTLSAFYTPQVVVKSIYKGLENLGFNTGNILEPACGTGNFIGSIPTEMKNSKFIGVEIDTISAEIAKQLYQNATITNQPFEKTNLPDSFFDVVVGNVPFGDFKVSDKKYDKNNFLIHDYFFAKSLDKLCPNGVMALVTSKGTMDKANPSFRRYLSQRADLIGAIRLPNSTFKSNAGTEVTSDILFLQKRDKITNIEADWVYLDTDKNGITMNSYFVEHPEMIVGKMTKVSGRFGEQNECILESTESLEEKLNFAIKNIQGNIVFNNTIEQAFDDSSENIDIIPANPDVKNFSYTIVDNKLYFRENSIMKLTSVNSTAENRIRGMIEIRDCLRTLITYQTENYSDEDIKLQQSKLNILYDKFTKKYGLINSRANKSAMREDSSYCLLSSLEIINENNELESKADIFTKRTIKPHKVVTSVDTSSEALAISIGEKARVDIDYMIELTGKSENEIYSDLQGVIFLNPLYNEESFNDKYLNADEYLSGNVREKLTLAKKLAEKSPEYDINVLALEKVQPEELKASEISVRLGSTWIPTSDVKDFIFETLETPIYLKYDINVTFVEYTGEWNISGKSIDRSNIKAHNAYGTSRVNAYKIIEDTLNLRDTRVFDYETDAEGRVKAVLNKKETTLAQSKQELLKQKFVDWIWQKPERRERLTNKYNVLYNSNRTREYDGSHINFIGMNSEIQLRKHQINAIARILYGGNTLLAHCVGAGKTFEMVASAMEKKRLGLCSKSLFVVPNHLTEQWAKEFLQLYPSANILVATKKDFETKNRKRFCSRIATGDYDAVIIGHSQFEKIPMSIERQRYIIEEQINEVILGIEELKNNKGENYSIKAMEKTKKSLEKRLEKLNDQSRKDDVITFEELGVDSLFVDESHYYKNLFLYTKMRNVGGIAQTEAQKSSDLYMKCRYLDEITGGKGIVFATGTPISNSMVELYTIQRYLQYNRLVDKGLQHFDSWASTFGETVTAIELNPEGSGYRAKTRFAKFYNLPELMTMFKEVADIQTADMLNLPVPKANFHNIAVKPSELQIKMVDGLSKRADKVRNRLVDSTVDNMLKITNDGRKLALDQRMIDSTLPDFEGSKVNACADNIYNIWLDGTDKKTTQLVFCDLSTPNNTGKFNVYDDIKNKLVEKGIPEKEIQFIHSAKTEAKKMDLFSKVRSGEVRILFGSTAKMGAGTNVQDRLIASHDIDCPWRPSDLEQRLGRTVRQGNTNEEVDIYRYVTEKTFDAYLYQLVEGKQKFASQIMTSKTPVRIAEDIDEASLSYAEIKMLATGNPLIKEKMDLDIQVQKLNLLKSNYLTTKFDLEDKILKSFPQEILAKEMTIKGIELDMQVVKENPKSKEDFVGLEIYGQHYSDKKEAGMRLLTAIQDAEHKSTPQIIGEYRGFKIEISYDIWEREFDVKLKNNLSHYVKLGNDTFGNIQRMDNVLESLDKLLDSNKNKLDNLNQQLENAKIEVNKPFEYEKELAEKVERLNELNSILNLDNNNENTENSEEKFYYQEVDNNSDKDLLINKGYDNYVEKDGKYIFKVSDTEKDNIQSLLSNNSKKLCV